MKNWFARLRVGFARFMEGRYGTDKLTMAILSAGLLVCLASIFVPFPLNPVFALISYLLTGWAIFRTLSRNTYKRYQENRRYLNFLQRFKDREHRYYACPRCRQSVRVPKGKGKIAIKCPKCGEKFIKKT